MWNEFDIPDILYTQLNQCYHFSKLSSLHFCCQCLVPFLSEASCLWKIHFLSAIWLYSRPYSDRCLSVHSVRYLSVTHWVAQEVETGWHRWGNSPQELIIPKHLTELLRAGQHRKSKKKKKEKKDMESWGEEKQKCLQFMPPNQFLVNTVSGMGTSLFNKSCYDL